MLFRSKGFLATTIACAQCHEHKLDAVAQRDYYALSGIFMSTRWDVRRADAGPEGRREGSGEGPGPGARRHHAGPAGDRTRDRAGSSLADASARRGPWQALLG